MDQDPEEIRKEIFVPESLGGEPPERYIRTFEGDVDIFNRGGTPGLAPLKKSAPPAPSERLVAASPVIAMPTPIPAPAPEAEPEPQPEPEPPQEVEVVPVVAPVEQPVSPPVSPLQTYAQDFRDRLKKTQASTVTVLAAEQDAGPHESVVDTHPAERSHTLWYIAAGIALILISGVGVYVAYSRYLAPPAPVVVTPTTVAPIFVDSTQTISGTGATLLRAVTESVAEPLPVNTVKQLRLDPPTESDNLFASLGLPIPGIILRNSNATGNMAGVVRTSSGQSPFFILSVSSYSTTFSGMLSWESFMQRDINALFPLYPAPAPTVASSSPMTATSSPRTASTTPVTPSVKEGFRDEVVNNHDVRIYRDALGRSIIVYGYWDQTIMIIARDPAAFSEILVRLANSRSI